LRSLGKVQRRGHDDSCQSHSRRAQEASDPCSDSGLREALGGILEATGPRSCVREGEAVVEVESLERAEELRKLFENLGARTRLEVDLEAVYRRAPQAPKS